MADVTKLNIGGTDYNIVDASVPSWAKLSTKPTYTASEVGAMATTHPANNITAQLISNWSSLLDTLKVVLNLTNDNDVLTFTDANSNTLTHSLVITLLEDNTKDIIVMFTLDYQTLPYRLWDSREGYYTFTSVYCELVSSLYLLAEDSELIINDTCSHAIDDPYTPPTIIIDLIVSESIPSIGANSAYVGKTIYSTADNKLYTVTSFAMLGQPAKTTAIQLELSANAIYYNKDDNKFYRWTGNTLTVIGYLDLSNYVPTSRTINNKALTSNITLTASDVGALSSSTTIPSKVSDLLNDSGFITSETQLSKGTTTGNGNAVTDISVSNHTITLNKGETFLKSSDIVSDNSPTPHNILFSDLTYNHQYLFYDADDYELRVHGTIYVDESGSYKEVAIKDDIPATLKVGSVAGKLYRNNVGGSGNFSISGNSGCIPNLTAGTFTAAIYAKSATQSYTFRFNFGSVTYDLTTTNGEINDIREITIPANGTFSGSVINGSVASGTILYVVLYNYMTPTNTVGVAAVTNRYSDLDGTPTIDSTLTANGTNAVTGGAIFNAIENTKPVVVNVTRSGSSPNYTYSADKTMFEIQQLIEAGKTVIVKDWFDYIYPCTYYVCDTDDEEFSIWFSLSASSQIKQIQFSAWYNSSNLWEPESITYSEKSLLNYVPTSRTVNNKALSANITLSASDVGAASIIEIMLTTVSAVTETVDNETVTTYPCTISQLLPGKFYKFSHALDSLTISTLGTGSGMPVYGGKFEANVNDMTISLPASVNVPNTVPRIESGHTYEFNIADGVMLIADVS